LYRPKPDEHSPQRLTKKNPGEEPDKTVGEIHGNRRTEFTEPSHGAKTDAELEQADEEELRRKGKI
jgi:hypothetical protein